MEDTYTRLVAELAEIGKELDELERIINDIEESIALLEENN